MTKSCKRDCLNYSIVVWAGPARLADVFLLQWIYCAKWMSQIRLKLNSWSEKIIMDLMGIHIHGGVCHQGTWWIAPLSPPRFPLQALKRVSIIAFIRNLPRYSYNFLISISRRWSLFSLRSSWVPRPAGINIQRFQLWK